LHTESGLFFANECPHLTGKIEGLISSLGYETTLPVNMMKPKDYLSMSNTNAISGFELKRQLIRKKCFNDKSSLVFMASVMWIVGQMGKVGCYSSKGALISGMRAMALELVSYGIKVNSILPSVCKTHLIERMFSKLSSEKTEEITKMQSLGPGDPEDVALAAVYLW